MPPAVRGRDEMTEPAESDVVQGQKGPQAENVRLV